MANGKIRLGKCGGQTTGGAWGKTEEVMEDIHLLPEKYI